MSRQAMKMELRLLRGACRMVVSGIENEEAKQCLLEVVNHLTRILEG